MSRRSGRLEATKDGPKVVVQQVLQVDPPAPEPPATQEPPPEGPQAATKPELKTRLRPNRSSWRQRFSPPPPSKTKIKKELETSIKFEKEDDQYEEPEPEEQDEEEELLQEEEVEQAPMHEMQQNQHVLVVPEPEEQVEEEEPMEAEEAIPEQTQLMEIVTEEASESDRICAVVQQDQLIQQFGLNLVNMSTQPHSRPTILAVSQRMIELVRLLRAAQGMNENIDSLASLFHIDYWPLILEAIKYVCGYEEGTAKNPQYIFDIGQALRFCAYILKREAQENENAAYEEQAQQFLDTIEANISTITTNQPVSVVAEQQPVETETVTEIVTEEPNQYRVVLSNSSGGDAQPVTLSLQVSNDNMALPGTVQVVKIISTPSGKKGIIIPTRILSKKALSIKVVLLTPAWADVFSTIPGADERPQMLTFLRKHVPSGPPPAAPKLSIEDLLKQEPPPEASSGRPKLCRALTDVVADAGAVSLLLQFLRPRGAAPFLLFWMEAARMEGRPPPWPSPTVMDDRSEAAIAIFERFFAPDASERVSFPRGLVEAVEAVIRRKEPPPKDIFHPLQEYAFQVINKDHFDEFLKSEFYHQHQVEVLTSGQVRLADLLLNESALFYFTEFMEQEGHQILVEFWLSATNFQKHMSDEPAEAQADAIVLYDKYFSLQATSPLGFGDSLRLQVEEKICGEFGPSADCFEKAAAIGLHAMERMFLPDFLQSQLYLRYLADLLQASNSTLNSTSNSVETTQTGVNTWDDSDPDSIWKRSRQNSGLSLGRIDELGRFEADFEPEPEARRESRLSRVMRRLVRPQDEEELAWRVAEMIVRDVTSVTLGPSNGAPSRPQRRPSTADS